MFDMMVTVGLTAFAVAMGLLGLDHLLKKLPWIGETIVWYVGCLRMVFSK